MLSQQLYAALQAYLEKYYQPKQCTCLDIDLSEPHQESCASIELSDEEPFEHYEEQEKILYSTSFDKWPEFHPQIDKQTFYEKIIAIINKKGLDEVKVYNAAQLDRRLFSKLRKANYHPGKNTVIALALALQLNLDEALDLLHYAGYALSANSEFDVIIKFCLEKGIYDIFEVNEALYTFTKCTL